MYQVPETSYPSNAKAFGGWVTPGVNNGSYNMSWPIFATQSPNGWQMMVQGYQGYVGRNYNAVAELDYFNEHFPKRNL